MNEEQNNLEQKQENKVIKAKKRKTALKMLLLMVVFGGATVYADGDLQSTITTELDTMFHLDHDVLELDHELIPEEEHSSGGGGGRRSSITEEEYELMIIIQDYYTELIEQVDWENLTEEETLAAQIEINDLIKDKSNEIGLDYYFKPFDVEHDHDEEDHEDEDHEEVDPSITTDDETVIEENI